MVMQSREDVDLIDARRHGFRQVKMNLNDDSNNNEDSMMGKSATGSGKEEKSKIQKALEAKLLNKVHKHKGGHTLLPRSLDSKKT